MIAHVFLNAGAGGLVRHDQATRRDSVERAFESVGIAAVVSEVRADRLTEAVTSAVQAGAEVVVAGGGDGTLSTVAGVLAGTRVPLGILPLGTLNHFARDLGLPLTLAEAVGVIAAGNVSVVDVAEVNGRIFVNNSSLGVYPRLVLERDAFRSRLGLGKWSALAIALLKLLRRFPLVDVELTTEGQVLTRRTPLVFVGNNAYELDLAKGGSRARLDRGELSLYIANVSTRWGVVKLIARTLFGQLKQAEDFHRFALRDCRIASRRHRIHVAVDGEVIVLAPPLVYQTRTRSLQVFVP